MGIYNEEKIVFLRKYIEDILDFIIEHDEYIYYDKITELNKICDEIYENDSSYINSKNTCNSDIIINDTNDDNNGTSIFVLMKKNKHL